MSMEYLNISFRLSFIEEWIFKKPTCVYYIQVPKRLWKDFHCKNHIGYWWIFIMSKLALLFQKDHSLVERGVVDIYTIYLI